MHHPGEYHPPDNFSLTYESPRHLRQSSHVSDRSSSSYQPSYSDLSFSWTGSSRHSRQSSHLSSVSGQGLTNGHSRQSSDLSYDNRAYDRSPPPPAQIRHFHQPHSRQSSYDHSPAPGHQSYSSPTPPMFKLPPNFPKYSPVSQDQGYHTMVGLHSSPDTSPGASLDLGSLSHCPPAVVRPQPPDVPSISLDHRNMEARFQNTSRDMLDMLEDELLMKILFHVDTVSLVRCSAVSRRLYHLVWHHSLWSTLSLTGDTWDTDQALRSILTCLSRVSGGTCPVSEINLSYCSRLSDSGLGVISRTCSSLTQLRLRSCKLVTNTGVADIVTRCSDLGTLETSGCTLVSGLEPSSRGDLRERLCQGLVLTCLDMTDCVRLDDLSLRLIVQSSPQLEFLYLRRCSNITGNNIIDHHFYHMRNIFRHWYQAGRIPLLHAERVECL